MGLGFRGGKQLRTARLASVGIELSVSTVVGLLAGRWLDRWLETEPYLSLVGLLIGVVAGFRSLIRTVRKAQQDAERTHDDQSRS